MIRSFTIRIEFTISYLLNSFFQCGCLLFDYKMCFSITYILLDNYLMYKLTFLNN